MKQPLFFKVNKDGKVLEVRQFTKQQIVIGREGEVDLLLSDSSVSPIHAMVEEREENKFFVLDLGSQSGTEINGREIVDEALNDGDVLKIGNFSLDFSIGIPKPKATPGAKPMVKPPRIEEVENDPLYARPDASTPTPPRQPEPEMRGQDSLVAPPVKEVRSEVKPEVRAEAPKPKVEKPQQQPQQAKPAATEVFAAAGGGVVVNRAPSRQAPAPASKGTYAPGSQVKNLRETIKPGRGGVCEILVAWQDRVLTTYHFEKTQVIQVGSHPKNQVVLPDMGGILRSHPLVKVESGNSTIYLTPSMTGYVYRENGGQLTFDELKRQGAIASSGGGFSYSLQQNEVVQINLGDGVSLWLRYVANAPPAMLAPMLELSINQLTAMMVSLALVGLFIAWVVLYAPEAPEKVEEETEPPRRAQFIYKRMQVAEAGDVTQEATQKAPEEKGQKASSTEMPVKDKEVAKSRNEEGAASAAAPNKSKSTVKKVTTPNPGKDKGIKVGSGAKSADAPAAAVQPQKDVKTQGLLGAFATGGVQQQLNRANQGAGMAGGAAKNASGAGSETAGAGTEPGGGTRDIGVGGNGTSTVGIAGVNTKGRGGGVSGYGTGSIGGKKNATILAGGDDATFTGSIDRDAIRRVVQQNIKQIKNCYERALNKDPGLYGKIVIQWTIGPGGRVLEASTKSTTMNSPEVENCAVNQLRTWKFPEPPADQVAVVSYPFVFQAQE